MKRRDFVFAAALCAAAPYSRAQTKVARIGFLAGGSRSGDEHLLAAFWRRFRELGYQEGKNVVAEYRFAEGALERLPAYAKELVQLKVDVIVGPGSGVREAKNATNAIPIVITVGDPVGAGFAASLARPGGNVTGLSSFMPELGAKQLEVLKDAFPRLRRIVVLWSQADRPRGQRELLLGDIENAARKLGVALDPFELRAADDIDPAFARIGRTGIEGLVVLRNPFTATHRRRIVDFANRARLPAIYPDREFADAGGLMSYGANVPDLWARAAEYVDKILRGSNPALLPIEQPSKFELVVNLKTAKVSGITVPLPVLLRADRVIE